LAFSDFAWPAEALANGGSLENSFPAIRGGCSLCPALSKNLNPKVLLPKMQMLCQEGKLTKERSESVTSAHALAA
jgi:hypothetical protein